MTKRARIMEATMNTTTTETDVSDEEIDQLRTEAAAAGDEEQVQLCDLALAGDASARVLRADPTRVDGLWCPVRLVGGGALVMIGPSDGPVGVRGRPNPAALRRTGVQLKLLLPPGENEAAKRDAAQREMSLSNHVRDLLRQWRFRR